MMKKWCPSFDWSCFRNASISVGTALQRRFNKHCEVLFLHQNRELCHSSLFLRDLHVDWTGKSSLHSRGGGGVSFEESSGKRRFSEVEGGSGAQGSARARTARARGVTGGPAGRRQACPPPPRGRRPPRPGPGASLRGLPGHHERCARPAPPSALPAARGAPAARGRGRGAPGSAPHLSPASASAR